MYKPEIYNLIKLKWNYKQLHLGFILEQHDHIVLRQPPYNPIEQIWVRVQSNIEDQNVSNQFKLAHVMEQIFSELTIEDW